MTNQPKPQATTPTDTQRRLCEQFMIGYAVALARIPEEWVVHQIKSTASVHGHQWGSQILATGMRPHVAQRLMIDLGAAYTIRVTEYGDPNPQLERALLGIALSEA